ncbi:zinc finger BED domain-containing protein RICESLEEPER 2-like protein [Tanacetum coccineum]
MASESASASTATGVGSTSAPTIREIIATNRNPQIWKDFNLCIMTESQSQCKHCFHFYRSFPTRALRKSYKLIRIVKQRRHNRTRIRKRGKRLWLEMGVFSAALNPCFNVNGVDFLIESISTDLEFFDDSFASKSKSYFKESLEGFWKEKETMYPVLSRMAMDIISVQAFSIASKSAFSTSGRVLSIQRTRLTPASLEMCMCLKDHLDAKERNQDKSPLEIPLDFKEDVLDDEVQRNEAIQLSDEEIALDASREGTLSLGEPRYDYMMSSEEAEDDY